MDMINVRGLKKSFGELEVLKDVSFTLEKGGVLAVLGSSGSGKSTLLRCLINLERADGGDIIIEGENLVSDGVYPKEARVSAICSKMGMVFQNFNLFPHMTVRQNLLVAPRLHGKDEHSLNKRCMSLLEKVGLQDKEKCKPAALSGGQKQRVAIARALMLDPDIMLFDEPTSSLDPELTAEVLETIKKLADDNMTMLIVTHEIGFAREAASRIIFMDDGIITEEGSPDEVLENPKNERTRAFLGKVIS